MNSRIILAKGINMDRDYNNVLSYSESDMLTLLRSQAHLVREASDYSFIRGTGQLDTQFTYAECLGANYIAFQNPDYSNKWFFAWIDDVQYRGNYNTRLIYTIDAWSTWFGDWTAKKCFINRHHVNDDTIGANRVPENLAINDIIQLSSGSIPDLTYYYIAVQTSWILKENSNGYGTLPSDKGEQFSGICVYNRQVFGTPVVLFGEFTESSTTNAELYTYLLRYIARCNNDGHIGDIENIFIVPSILISSSARVPHYAEFLDNTKPIYFYTLNYSYSPKELSLSIPKENSFSDYQPKNNKCYTYPWNYIYVTNNNGNQNIYKYEDFYSQENCIFKIWIAMSIGISGKCFPENYKYQSADFDNSIPLGKYPVCGWSSDAFTNWLTSQAVNIATSWIPTMSAKDVEEESTPLTGVDVGIGIARKTAQIIGGLYTGSLMPNIIGGNNNTADVLWAGNQNNIIFKKMRASLHDLKIADDYFTRFGYAIHKLEMPNITGRRYWNYVEIGSTEEIGYGTVPHNFMDTINNACRKGVTIWHNHDSIGNWDLTNDII